PPLRPAARRGAPGGRRLQRVLVTAPRDRAGATGDHCLRGQAPDVARRPVQDDPARHGINLLGWRAAFDRAGQATRPAAAEFAAGAGLTLMPCLRSMGFVRRCARSRGSLRGRWPGGVPVVPLLPFGGPDVLVGGEHRDREGLVVVVPRRGSAAGGLGLAWRQAVSLVLDLGGDARQRLAVLPRVMRAE